MTEQISRERDSYLLNGIPSDLRNRLSQEAREQDTSVNNIIGDVLSERYSLAFEGSGRALKSDFRAVGETLLVRLPPAVIMAVRHEAYRERVAMRSIILHSLAEHFDLPPPSITRVNPQRRPGRPKHGRPRGRKAKL